MTATREIARARPLLGTIVAIRVAGLHEREAVGAIESAFCEIAEIQRCMSFHDSDSDLSRLHRANGKPTKVNARTYDVLARSLALADESSGLFDPTVAATLVDWNVLPRPDGAAAEPHATWRDVELLDDHCVRLRRATWIDLGGIAKGFAVDRALAILRLRGCASASVNAGGDLARFGASTESVMLDPRCAEAAVAIELGSDALATSTGNEVAPSEHARSRGVHVHGLLRRAAGARRSVSVVAGTCCIADALTKVVLADARAGERLLRRHGAHAFVFDTARGWRRIGTS